MPDSTPISEVSTSASPPSAQASPPTFPRGYIQWAFWILAAVILLLGLTALVQALTGNTVTVQVIIGLAVVVALLAFLPRVVDVESFHMGKGGVTLTQLAQNRGSDAGESMP